MRPRKPRKGRKVTQFKIYIYPNEPKDNINSSISVSLEIEKPTDRVGSLYGLYHTTESQVLDKEPLMDDVIDVKATNTDVIVLTSAGTVAILVNGCHVKKLSFPAKVAQISAGCEHAACLLENHQLFVWGSFENPGFMFRQPYVPVQVLKDQKIVKLASGRDHLVMLTQEGVVYTMGCGAQGQLGRVSERVAMDGGRKGPQLLLAPARLHMNMKHKADTVWATKCGTFYRDIKSGAIFGCGKNEEQNVSPVNDNLRKRKFIFTPTLTTFKDVKELGDRLLLKEGGELFSCSSSIEDHLTSKWTALEKSAASVHCGPSLMHFIDEDGDVSEFKTKKRITTVYIASENDSLRAISVCATDDKTFLVIE